MQPRSRAALAVYFGSFIGLALVASFFASEPATTTGQVVHNPTNSAQGFLIEPGTNVYFSCPKDSTLLSSDIGDASAYAFWMYEFTGNEPPSDGRYFISPPILSGLNINPSLSTLKGIIAGNMYYLTSATPLSFRCGEGLRAQPVCGNGIKEGLELCDGVKGCTDACKAETGYSCSETENSCSVLVPTLGGSSSAPNAGMSSERAVSSSSAVAVSSEDESSSAAIAAVSSSQGQTSSSNSNPSSIARISSSRQAVSSAPKVKFNEYEMEYSLVPNSNDLLTGKEFAFELRIKNKANAPRSFEVVQNTGVSDANTTEPYKLNTATLGKKADYITADTTHQDPECSTKPSPYFGRWRTYCKYILKAGEERTVRYELKSEKDFDCTSSLFATASLEAAVTGSYGKTIERHARIFPNNCGFGVSTPVSCVPLAGAQALQGRYRVTQYTRDKIYGIYYFSDDGAGVTKELYSLNTQTCTTKQIASVTGSNRVGQAKISDTKDIVYEISQWYVVSGHPKRAIHRVDGVTGVDETIVPYAPTDTGLGSLDLSNNGKRVTFVASWVNLDTNNATSVDNNDLSSELYLWENGIITQLSNCTPEKYDNYNNCTMTNPRFTDTAGRFISIGTDFDPKTGIPHEPRYTVKYYKYDTEEGKFL